MECQRASRSVPMPFSSGVSRAISATRTTTPYPARSPRISPMLISRAPGVDRNTVVFLHRQARPRKPSPMTVSTTMGSTIRAFPVPGVIGLAVRTAPVRRVTPVALSAPVVLVGSSAGWAPVARAGASAGLALVARTELAGGAAADCQGGNGSPGWGPGPAAGQAPVSREGAPASPYSSELAGAPAGGAGR